MVEKPLNRKSLGTIRTTVSVPTADYQQLERIAGEKKVSVAWVVRDAIDSYLRNVATKPKGRVEGEE